MRHPIAEVRIAKRFEHSNERCLTVMALAGPAHRQIAVEPEELDLISSVHAARDVVSSEQEQTDASMTIYDYEELKMKMVETANLAEFQDYFLSNFVEKGRFMSLGRGLSRARGEFLVHAIGEAYHKLSGATVIDLKHQLIELPEFQLIHGAIYLNGTSGSVVYLEEIGMGVMLIVENPATGAVKYVRFAVYRPTARKPN